MSFTTTTTESGPIPLQRSKGPIPRTSDTGLRHPTPFTDDNGLREFPASSTPSKPTQPAPASSGWGANPAQPAPTSSGWGSKPAAASSGWGSNPTQPTPTSSGWDSHPARAAPNSSGWGSKPAQPAPVSSWGQTSTSTRPAWSPSSPVERPDATPSEWAEKFSSPSTARAPSNPTAVTHLKAPKDNLFAAKPVTRSLPTDSEPELELKLHSNFEREDEVAESSDEDEVAESSDEGEVTDSSEEDAKISAFITAAYAIDRRLGEIAEELFSGFQSLENENTNLKVENAELKATLKIYQNQAENQAKQRVTPAANQPHKTSGGFMSTVANFLSGWPIESTESIESPVPHSEQQDSRLEQAERVEVFETRKPTPVFMPEEELPEHVQELQRNVQEFQREENMRRMEERRRQAEAEARQRQEDEAMRRIEELQFQVEAKARQRQVEAEARQRQIEAEARQQQRSEAEARLRQVEAEIRRKKDAEQSQSTSRTRTTPTPQSRVAASTRTTSTQYVTPIVQSPQPQSQTQTQTQTGFQMPVERKFRNLLE